MDKFFDKIKLKFKKDNKKRNLQAELYRAKTELEDAIRSFNETVDSDYIDVAILNLNLARKKYELCISELKASCAS